jgi:hypothetical protein
MARGEVRRFACWSDLDRSGEPGNEGGQLALVDAKEGLIELSVELRKCEGRKEGQAREQRSTAVWKEKERRVWLCGEETYIGRVHVTLDDVEDGDIARGFTRRHGDHTVLGLEEAPHDVQYCCFADGLRLCDERMER